MRTLQQSKWWDGLVCLSTSEYLGFFLWIFFHHFITWNLNQLLSCKIIEVNNTLEAIPIISNYSSGEKLPSWSKDALSLCIYGWLFAMFLTGFAFVGFDSLDTVMAVVKDRYHQINGKTVIYLFVNIIVYYYGECTCPVLIYYFYRRVNFRIFDLMGGLHNKY